MTTTEEVFTKSLAAASRIADHIEHTPLVRNDQVFYKCENLQVTGSFKARGALSKVTSLSGAELGRGVVTASTGNHGAALAYASRIVGTQATVYVPSNASQLKLRAIADLGGHIEFFGSDGVESENEARRVATETGRVYVSPYNDIDVIAGQGTIGVELLEDLPDIDVLVVAVGGGGLVSGVASVLRQRRPDVRVIACSPKNSAVMAASLRAGQILEMPSLETISDGTHGGVEQGSITFELCQELIDEFVTVPEEEIFTAMRTFIETRDMRIEGSAGVALAAYSRMADELSGLNTVVVLCGSNISDGRLQSL